MTALVKVYHPETDEMFEVPSDRAQHLILNEGWFQHPVDADAVPAVVSAPVSAPIIEDDWRKSTTDASATATPAPTADATK